jgi:uncharacterized protein YlzI (FlbEa/FlbD family)
MIIVLHQRLGEILAVNTAHIVSIQETHYDWGSATKLKLTDGAVFSIKESPEEVVAKIEGAKQ